MHARYINYGALEGVAGARKKDVISPTLSRLKQATNTLPFRRRKLRMPAWALRTDRLIARGWEARSWEAAAEPVTYAPTGPSWSFEAD